MSRRTVWIVAGGALTVAVGCGGWAWALAGLTLEEADQWSSVLAGFAALVFGIAGVVLGVVALRSPAGQAGPAETTPPGAASTGASGARSVVVHGSNDGTIVTGDGNTIGPPQ